jgi:hypothetical protein
MVDWRWIGGGKVKGVGGRVAVVVEWGLDEWKWRSSGGGSGGGGEGGCKGNLSVVAVARAVELWWIGGGVVVEWRWWLSGGGQSNVGGGWWQGQGCWR